MKKTVMRNSGIPKFRNRFKSWLSGSLAMMMLITAIPVSDIAVLAESISYETDNTEGLRFK